MSGTDFDSVDEYIAAQPEAVQSVLKRVRSTIRKALPKAEEVISYKIPAYKLHNRPVVYFAAWKQHYALYPGSGRLVAELKDELASYAMSKGTIRFQFSDAVPVKLIERIARLRAREVTEQERSKTAEKKSG